MKGNAFYHFRGPSVELEVERIVLEAFSRAFTDASRLTYDGIKPYSAYLFRIARNVMITEATAAHRAPKVTEDGNVPELESLAPTPAEVAEREEMVRLVRDFLHARPEDERSLYEARFRQGDSQAAAARRLGLSRITIRRTESRLKQAFVRFLMRQGLVTTDSRTVMGDEP
jgi:RNA polymerase sigma factor (sigma-70 family)